VSQCSQFLLSSRNCLSAPNCTCCNPSPTAHFTYLRASIYLQSCQTQYLNLHALVSNLFACGEHWWSHDSSGGVVQSYGADSRCSVFISAKDLSLVHSVETTCRALQAISRICTVSSFSGSKATGAWRWLFTSISSRNQERWRISPLSHMSSWRSA
jgi:hypothetical protein